MATRQLIYQVLAKCFILVISLILTVIVCDLIYEKFFYKKTGTLSWYSDALFYKPHPYIMFKPEPGEPTDFTDKNGELIYINNNGYRGPTPTQQKSINEFRIFILGGSAMFGAENDIASELQEVFRNNGYTNVNVYNYGIPSSNAGQNLSRLIFEIVDYAPDLVISYEGANDFIHPTFADPRPGYPFNFFIIESNPIYTKSFSEYPLLPTLLYSSSIMRNLFQSYFMKSFGNINKLRKNIKYMNEEWFQEVVDVFWNYLLKTQQISHSYQSDYIAIYQPMAFYKEPLADTELSPDYSGLNNIMLQLRDRLLIKAENDKNLNFYDASDAFDNVTRKIFKDPVHISIEGRVFMAKYFYNLIISCGNCKKSQKFFTRQ